MRAYEILTAIEHSLSPQAADYWDRWHEGGRNEALIVAQHKGLAEAVQLVEELAAHDEEEDPTLLPRHDFDTGQTKYV